MRIALTGNPNSGKTTMFNALTGRNEKVGNWAGVTVDRREYPIKKSFYNGNETLLAVDLPGAYSMSAYTSEESITSTYIKKEKPDVIINIVDATNISRSLFFTTQLLELGIPLVVALNKTDINKKKGTTIDINALSKALHCPVIETISIECEGLKTLIDTAVSIKKQKQEKLSYDGLEDRDRFALVDKIVSQVETRKILTKDRNINDKIDSILTNRYFGILIFAIIMYLVFEISQVWVGPLIADTLVAYIEAFQSYVTDLLTNANPLLNALLTDGIIGGVGAVIGFLPLVMVMYFLIALLEDCGYMSRVSVVLDPIFKKVGLSGKSVIPFVIGTGCAIPGIMASRTIRNERERRATAMLTPFMPCGAKIPVISLFAGAFFDNAGWVSFLMYFTGIALIFIGALLVNLITGYKNRKSYFIIELPEYKIPSLTFALKAMLARGKAYVIKAATIILLCNTAVQIMQTFTWSFTVAQTADASMLASIANPFAYILVPIVGVLSWQLAAAAVTGFIAKENVVGTLAVCFVGLENLIDVDALAMLEGTGSEISGIIAITKVAALAYLMFNLYTPPCFAAIGAMNSEMQSPKWLWGGIGLQLGMGYTIGFSVYQVGTLITTGTLGAGFAPGLVAVIIFVSIIVILSLKANKEVIKEYELTGGSYA